MQPREQGHQRKRNTFILCLIVEHAPVHKLSYLSGFVQQSSVLCEAPASIQIL